MSSSVFVLLPLLRFCKRAPSRLFLIHSVFSRPQDKVCSRSPKFWWRITASHHGFRPSRFQLRILMLSGPIWWFRQTFRITSAPLGLQYTLNRESPSFLQRFNSVLSRVSSLSTKCGRRETDDLFYATPRDFDASTNAQYSGPWIPNIDLVSIIDQGQALSSCSWFESNHEYDPWWWEQCRHHFLPSCHTPAEPW